MTKQLRPSVVLRWGIAATVGGSLFVILTPMAIDWMFFSGATTDGRSVQAIVEVILRTVASVLPPLGAALIAAAVVMTYIEQRERSTDVE